MKVFSLVLSMMLLLTSSFALADNSIVFEDDESETTESAEKSENAVVKFAGDAANTVVSNPAITTGVVVLVSSMFARARGVGFGAQAVAVGTVAAWPFKMFGKGVVAVGGAGLNLIAAPFVAVRDMFRPNPVLPGPAVQNAPGFVAHAGGNQGAVIRQDLLALQQDAQVVNGNVAALHGQVQALQGVVAQQNQGGGVMGLLKFAGAVKGFNVAHQMVCDRFSMPWICDDKAVAKEANKKIGEGVDKFSEGFGALKKKMNL